MKNQSGTIKTNLELDRVVMGVQVVTGDSQEEVLIFRDKQTHMHHNIYISSSIIAKKYFLVGTDCIPFQRPSKLSVSPSQR